MSLDTLLGGLESADLLTGHQLSPAEARRIACESGIVPVVLGGDSQVLDSGREQRFHTKPQRRLIFARDKTCRAEGCEIPANWCHVHHEDPWLPGGSTSVEKGLTLCSRHHTAAHDPRYTSWATRRPSPLHPHPDLTSGRRRPHKQPMRGRATDVHNPRKHGVPPAQVTTARPATATCKRPDLPRSERGLSKCQLLRDRRLEAGA